MCGIAGMYHALASESADGAVLATMNGTMRHRGPDDEGYFVEGPVGLAMRRLKVIDLEGGHQPLCNEDQSVWVVFNGEIYNFREIRRDLEQKGHRFATRSDTEVLVHLYEEQGEDFVSELRGMFAFALWDKKRKKLFLARDPIGIKPLYYHFKNGLLLFGSELKALMAHPAISRRIDSQALSDFLSFLYIPAPKSIFRDVRKLSPGHMLVVWRGECSIRRYWDLPRCADQAGRTLGDFKAELSGLARDAVKSQLVSDVPVGAFLSGGVDSSIVAALMAQEMGHGFNTYSVGFDSPAHNELSYAKLVAGHLGTRHHELPLDVRAMEDLPAVVAGFDEPFGDPSAIPMYHLSRFARQHVTVALAGDGGDELFAGYGWMRRHRWVEMAQRVPRFLREISGRMLGESQDPFEIRSDWLGGVSRFLEDTLRSADEAFYRRSTCCSDRMKDALFSDEMRHELGGYRSFDVYEQSTRRTGGSAYDAMLAWDSKIYLPDDDLCKVDRMSMAHSLEVRVPVLDQSLVEWSAGVPFSLKLKGLTTKYIWKETFRSLLPPLIFKQRKQGFSIPLQQWMGGYLPQIRRMVLAKDSFCASVFRPDALRRILDLQATGRFRLAATAYQFLVLEMWFRSCSTQKDFPRLADVLNA